MNHISAIQAKLREKRLDAVLIIGSKNQRYACGFPFSDGAVIVSQKKAWLITDSRYIEAAAQAAGNSAEVILFDSAQPLKARIRSIIKEAKVERLGAEERKLSYGAFLDYSRELGTELLPAQDIFTSLRASKDDEEIASMRQAQRIAEKALEETLPLIKVGMTERNVAAELVYRMLRHGSEGNSFDPIVITGRKTSMPHGVPGGELIHTGDFVTMDFGCIKNGYCSDMTRTVAVGEADEEMRFVYDTVLKAQKAGIAAARAGIAGREVDAAARRVISEAGYGDYFGHGFGHSLGLDIHESPNFNPSGTALMPVGAVVSAEPGIYLPGRFGVRIEDVLVLNETGCENITKAPKELIILPVA